jgi:hypothetical protein
LGAEGRRTSSGPADPGRRRVQDKALEGLKGNDIDDMALKGR